jgi:hypothetical protein
MTSCAHVETMVARRKITGRRRHQCMTGSVREESRRSGKGGKGRRRPIRSDGKRPSIWVRNVEGRDRGMIDDNKIRRK